MARAKGRWAPRKKEAFLSPLVAWARQSFPGSKTKLDRGRKGFKAGFDPIFASLCDFFVRIITRAMASQKDRHNILYHIHMDTYPVAALFRHGVG